MNIKPSNIKAIRIGHSYPDGYKEETITDQATIQFLFQEASRPKGGSLRMPQPALAPQQN